MRRTGGYALTLAICGPLLAAGCSFKPKGPSKEMVTPLLQQEANSLKRDGEKPDEKLGVKATWNVESVEVREQKDNETNPWAGTVKFKITSEMREVDGTPVVQTFDKRFEYLWSTTLNRWIIQYTPPS
jgi:hypothetical protein